MKKPKKQLVAPRTDMYMKIPPAPLVSCGRSLLLYYGESKIKLRV